jgi:hypothetical protein
MSALAVAVIAVLAVTAVYCVTCPAPWLVDRVLAEHDCAEAGLADLDAPFGGAACGCFWEYLDGGHIRIWTCDAHAFICTPDGEA